MPEGIILKGVGGLYTVKSSKGTYECSARGLFRKNDEKPLPGDYVQFEIIHEEEGEGRIHSINKRKNSLERPSVANIDLAFIVMAARDPEPDFILVDKLACVFEDRRIQPVICINKSEMAEKGFHDTVEDQYGPAGYPVKMISAKNDVGIDRIVEFIQGKTCVFAGQSGVGKSTIINKIAGREVMETGMISEKIGRGKHVTRHTNFIEAGQGYIVDTPGFSNLDAGFLEEPEKIKELYMEFTKYHDYCRFTGCRHINEPGCAVKRAVTDGEISKYRHERYVKIYMQAKEAETRKRGY